LYLHRLFTRLGYRITIHPDVPDSTGQPDFDLSRGDELFYVEAAVVFSGIVNEGRDEVREGWVMDAVNRGTSRNFHVGIEFERVGETPARPRHLPASGGLASGTTRTTSRRRTQRLENFPRRRSWWMTGSCGSRRSP
jgi:hypothetical protein